MRGLTAQRVPIAMRFDRPGHPVAFDTRIRGRCSHAGLRDWDWDWGWWPTDSDFVRFHRDGSALRVVQIDDRTFQDGSFFYYPDGPTTCQSQRVPFAAPSRRATSARPS